MAEDNGSDDRAFLETAPHAKITVPRGTSPRPRVRAEISVRPPTALARMLLPSETVRFGTRVHPVVLVRPVLAALGLVVLLAILLQAHVHVMAHAQRLALLPLTGVWRPAAFFVLLVPFAQSVVWFARSLSYYLSFKVVATNRRLFTITGIFGRRVAPVGYGALAGSELVQGPLGRWFDYGSIRLPNHADDRFRDLRDPIGMYREMQAVANGVDGESWAPATRQTIIP